MTCRKSLGFYEFHSVHQMSLRVKKCASFAFTHSVSNVYNTFALYREVLYEIVLDKIFRERLGEKSLELTM
jgi:hypothetical protein